MWSLREGMKSPLSLIFISIFVFALSGQADKAFAACSFQDNGDFTCSAGNDTASRAANTVQTLSEGPPASGADYAPLTGQGNIVNGAGGYDRQAYLDRAFDDVAKYAAMGDAAQGLSQDQLTKLANNGLSGMQPTDVGMSEHPKSSDVNAAENAAKTDDGTTQEQKHLTKGSVCDPNEDRPIDDATKSGISDLSARQQIVNRLGFRKGEEQPPDLLSDPEGKSLATGTEPISGQHLAYGQNGSPVTLEHNEKTGQHILSRDIEFAKNRANVHIDQLRQLGVPESELDHCLFANLTSVSDIAGDQLSQIIETPEFAKLIQEKKYKEAAELLRQGLEGEVGEDAARVIEALGGNVENPSGDDPVAASEAELFDKMAAASDHPTLGQCSGISNCIEHAKAINRPIEFDHNGTDYIIKPDGSVGIADSYGNEFISDAYGGQWTSNPDGSWNYVDPDGVTNMRILGGPEL